MAPNLPELGLTRQDIDLTGLGQVLPERTARPRAEGARGRLRL
jgi:hypothetical protein